MADGKDMRNEKFEVHLRKCERQRSIRGKESLHEEMCANNEFDWASNARYYSPVDMMESDCDLAEVCADGDDDAEDDACAGLGDFSFSIVDCGIAKSTASVAELEDYYSEEYYAWNLILEEKYFPGESLTNQPQVKSENRAALVGWLSKVIRSLDLFPETLFLTVNIVDRFLTCIPITLECFQLVGLAALFVAAKQLEIYHPSVVELLKLGAGVYSRQHFLQMERLILKQLQFNLVVATSLFFVEYYIACRPVLNGGRRSGKSVILLERPYRTMVHNLVELCVQDYNLCQYAPSCVALSSMAVVEEYANGKPADLTASRYTRWEYEPSLLKECATEIWLYLSRVLHGPIRELSEDTFFEQYQPSPEVT